MHDSPDSLPAADSGTLTCLSCKTFGNIQIGYGLVRSRAVRGLLIIPGDDENSRKVVSSISKTDKCTAPFRVSAEKSAVSPDVSHCPGANVVQR